MLGWRVGARMLTVAVLAQANGLRSAPHPDLPPNDADKRLPSQTDVVAVAVVVIVAVAVVVIVLYLVHS